MKIIAVIVEGELPNMCDECEMKSMGRCGYTGTFVYKLPARPSDCPLRLEWDNKKIANEVM